MLDYNLIYHHIFTKSGKKNKGQVFNEILSCTMKVCVKMNVLKGVLRQKNCPMKMGDCYGIFEIPGVLEPETNGILWECRVGTIK